jgi:hypothetical protein
MSRTILIVDDDRELCDLVYALTGCSHGDADLKASGRLK